MFISKSKYLNGLQCQKLLWYYYNKKESIPEPNAATRAIFDQGHEVGRLAKSLFPGGVEIAEGIIDIEEVVRKTLPALKKRKPLFEAGLTHKNAFARADVLDPSEGDAWDIVEVKSTTEVKTVHLHDLALQRYVYAGAGVNIGRCRLLHIDTSYVRKGDIDCEKLFMSEDVTSEVDKLAPNVESNLEEMERAILMNDAPERQIGPHCNDPYDCPLTEMCREFLPEKNVLQLSRIGSKGYDLIAGGILKISDISRSFRLSSAQKIEVDAVLKNAPHVDGNAIREFLDMLEYPLSFLDFETFMTAIPLYDDLSPYEKVPFQYSLHRIETPGASPVHKMFLADGRTDPRLEMLGRLKLGLGTKGSIVAYNMSFEKNVLKEAVAHHPAYETWLSNIDDRFVDLMEPFRSHWYYNPAQDGSYSIKSVLPALCGTSYDGMEISEGGTASNEYLRVTFGNVTDEEHSTVRGYLAKYCTQDTKAMIDIVEKLKELAG